MSRKRTTHDLREGGINSALKRGDKIVTIVQSTVWSWL